LLALVGLFVSTSLLSVGCAVGTTALPELPKVAGFSITGSTPSPLPTAFDGSAYSATVVSTAGGIQPLTSCTVTVAVQSGGPATAAPPNNLLPFSPGSGLSIGVNPANPSQCLISTPTGVVNAAPGTYTIKVRVADSSTPAVAATQEFTLVVEGGFTITTPVLEDAVVGRTYTKLIETNVGTPTMLGTLGVAPLSGCAFGSATNLPGSPSIAITTAPGSTIPGNACLITYTPPATASGRFTVVVVATDSATPKKNERSATFILTIRREFSVTAFTVVDAVAGRAYSKTFVVTTNLTNNAPTVTPAGGTARFGNGPITACSITGLPAAFTGAGGTASCAPAANGVSMNVTLSAPSGTLLAGVSTLTISVTDTAIFQPPQVAAVVPANTLTNATQPNPFPLRLTVRPEFVVNAITNPVDAVRGRSYTKSVAVTTNLQNNPVPSKVGSTEPGDGPITGCQVLDGATALTSMTGASVSLLNGLTVTCTFGAGVVAARVNFSGTVTPGAADKRTLTVRIFDSPILQSGATVVNPAGVGGNALVTNTFMLTFRPEFSITPFTVVDGVAGRGYSKTFVVSTNLTNNAPTVTPAGGTAPFGNGPITACLFTGLPAGITATSCTVNAGGISVTATLAGTPSTRGTVTSTVTITDSDVLQSGAVVVAKQAIRFSFSFTIRQEFSVTETFVVDGIFGRAYTKHINTSLLAAAGPSDVGQTTEFGNGPAATCTATIDTVNTITSTMSFGGFTIVAETNGCRLSATTVSLTAATTHTLVVSVTDNLIPQAGATVVPAGRQTKSFSLTIRREFSVTEPSLVDGVLGRAYTKHINTSLSSTAPAAVGSSTAFGNGPPATCTATIDTVNTITSTTSFGGFTIVAETNGCRLSTGAGTVSLAAGTHTVIIKVTDNRILQLNSLTSTNDTIVLANTISSISYTLRIRTETKFRTTTVVDGVKGRSYTKTLVTDKTTSSTTTTGGGNLTTCTLGAGAPSGLAIAVASNSLDCALSGTITAAAGTYTFTVSAADTALTELNSSTGMTATVVVGSTITQSYTLVVRNEFSFLTTSVVDGVAGRAYSKLVETNLSDTALTSPQPSAFGNGPTAAGACRISSTGVAGTFTPSSTATVAAVPSGTTTFTLAVAPDPSFPGSCRLTVVGGLPPNAAPGQTATFFINATDNIITQTNLRTTLAENVVPANTIRSMMLTLTIRGPLAFDLAASNCNFSAAGVAGAGTNCPNAVKNRTYHDQLVRRGGGSPPLTITVTAGNFTLAAGTWTGNAGTTCEGITIGQTTGLIDGTPTGATSGTCPFTLTLDDSGIKQATLAAHGATLAGTLLTVVPASPPGTATASLSITVSAAMSIVNTSLAGALKNNPYSAKLAAQFGLTTAGPVGLPATLTWSNPGGSVSSLNTLVAACSGLSLNSLTGVISGTPTTAGRCTPISIRVDDNGNAPGCVGAACFVPPTPPGQAPMTFTIVVNDTLGFVSNNTGSNVRVIRTDTNTATASTYSLTVPGTPQGITVNPTDPLIAWVAGNTSGFVESFCTRVSLPESPECPAAFAPPVLGPTVASPRVGPLVTPTDVAVANAPITFFTGSPNVTFGAIADPTFGGVRFFQAQRTSSFFRLNAMLGSVVYPGARRLSIRPQSDFLWVVTGTSDTIAEICIFGPAPPLSCPGAAPSITVTVTIPGSILYGVAVSPDGRFVYVTDTGNRRVHVIDSNPASATYRTRIASTPAAGAAGGLKTGAVPHGIRFAPDGRFVYISDNFNNVVAAIDPATLSPLPAGTGTVTVTNNNIGLLGGTAPEGIALTDDSKKAFVADNTSNSVTAIDTNPSDATIATIVAAPTGAVRAANVVTITTTSAHGLSVGQGVTISGVADTSFDGTFVVCGPPTAGCITPTTTTFTYQQIAPPATSGGGTVGTFQDPIVTFNGAGNFSAPFGVATMPDPHLHILNPLPNAITGRAYSFSVVAAGGTRPYTFAAPALSGTGLSINPMTGLITGAPLAVGTITVDATVTDSSTPQQAASHTFTITVFNAAAIPVPSPLPNAIAKAPYSASLDSTGGSLAIVWSDGGTLAANANCAGLTLSVASLLSGTPTGSGTCMFKASFRDANGTVSPPSPISYTLTVTARPTSTSVALASASDPVAMPDMVTVTVTDTSAGTTSNPTGTVTFTSSSATPNNDLFTPMPSCTLAAVAMTTNQSSCSVTVTPTLPAGTHTIKASYPGDAAHLASSGSAGLTVTLRTTMTTVGFSPTTVDVSGSSTVTFTVTDTNAVGATPPMGTVMVSSNVGSIDVFSAASCTLAAVAMSLTTSSCTVTVTPATAPPSTHTISGTYAPALTDDHATSSGMANLTVLRKTSTTVKFSVNPVNTGGMTTVTATVADTTLTGTASFPAGTVAFTSNAGDTFSAPSCTLAQVVTTTTSSCSVTLTASATISTHTITATYTPTDSVHDTSMGTGSLTVKALVLAPFAAPTLAPAVQSRPILTINLLISGGTAPYTCTATGVAGIMAAFMTVAGTPNCQITGTPTATGTFTLTVMLSDSAAHTDMQSTTLTVNLPLMITTTSPLPNAEQNLAYSPGVTFMSSGGTPGSADMWNITTANFTCAAGTCTGTPGPCAGFSLNQASGAFTGTPTTPGMCTLSLVKTDTANSTTGSGTTAATPFTVTVGAPLAVTQTGLINALRGSPYGPVTLLTSGGLGTAITWSVTAGDFTANAGNTGTACQGFSLASSTGVLSGTPVNAGLCATGGTGTFTVTATEASNGPSPARMATKALTITVLGTFAFVTDESSNNQIDVIDTTSNANVVGGTIAGSAFIPAGTSPQAVAVTPDGAKTGVAFTGSDSLGVISNTTSPPSVASATDVSATCSSPNAAASANVPSVGLRSYVVCNSGVVLVINVATGAVTTLTLMEGVPPAPAGNLAGVAFRPDGKRAYVTDTTNNQLCEINATTATQVDVDTATAGIQCLMLGPQISPVGVVAVANSAANAGAGGFYAYVAKRDTVLAGGVDIVNVTNDTINVANPLAVLTTQTTAINSQPFGVAANPGNTRVFVTLSNAGQFAVFDNTVATPGAPTIVNANQATVTMASRTGGVGSTATFTTAQPHGFLVGQTVVVTISPDPNVFSTGAAGAMITAVTSTTFTIMQGGLAASATVTGTAFIPGSGPRGITIPPSDAGVYISLFGSAGVAIQTDASPFGIAAPKIALPGTTPTPRGIASIPVPFNLAITTASLTPAPTPAMPYTSNPITAAGGVGALTWSATFTGAACGTGGTINSSTGVISITTTGAGGSGTCTIVVRVTDTGSPTPVQTATATFSFTL